MSTTATDVKNILVQDSSNLQKVPIDHLDYKYITNCTSTKELSRILRVLRSGEEGYYPQLIRHCEERIEVLDPKSRALRKDKPVLHHGDLQVDEASSIKEDLQKFISSTKERDSSSSNIEPSGDDGLPPIRGFQSVNTQGKKVMVNGTGDSKTKNKNKLKSYDYEGWDKFDVDKECEKVDKEGTNDLSAPSPQTKPKIRHALNTSNMSAEERETRAVYEKDKGNEAFKSGDMDEAITYYTRSINLHPLVPAINNRALAYLKNKNWKKAAEDCNSVLSMPDESENIKACLRRATAYTHLGKHQQAFKDLTFVIEKEPKNVKAKSLLIEVEEELEKMEKNKPQSKGKKMQIVEVDDESSEEEIVVEEKPGGKDDQEKNERNDGTTSHKDQVSSQQVNSPTSIENKTTNSEEKKCDTSQSLKKSESVKADPEVEKIEVIPLPAHIDNLKKAGGNSFRIGQYADASQHYTKAINTLMKFCEGNKEKQKNYRHGRAVLHNNRAACYLKSGNDTECIKDCNSVLEINKWDYKALTRRGCAYEHVERYRKAYVDFKSALSMNWSDPFLVESSNRVARHLRELDGPQWRDKLPHISVFSGSNLQSAEPQKPTLSINNDPTVKFEKETMQNNDEMPKTPSTSTEKPTGSKSDMKPPKTEAKSKPDAPKAESKTKPAPKKTKEDELAEKKEQIRRNVFEKLKSDGNNHVKKGNYEEAVKCYTKCMTMCPEEPASYTNRALCFLKLNKPISAVIDCTKAIELDSRNVKAYFRRSLARKSEKFYKDAEDDLNTLLKIEPSNVLAKKELKTIKSLREKSYLTPQPKPAEKAKPKQPTNKPQENKTQEARKTMKKMLIEEVSEDEEETKESQAEESVHKEEAAATPPMKESVTKKVISSTSDVKKGENEAPGAEYQSSIQPTYSENEIIRQPYEFGHQWNAVQSENIQKYKEILDRINPADLPRLLSNKTDDHVIEVVALVCKDYINSGTEGRQRALKLMRGLAKADRFTVAGMFMSSTQKSNVDSTIQLFQDATVVKELLHLYKDVL